MSVLDDELRIGIGKSVKPITYPSKQAKEGFARMISRTPEVMVKVSKNNEKVNGKTVVKSPRDEASLRGLMKYVITEPGDMIDEDGNKFYIEDQAKALDNWKGLNTERKGSRIALHVVFSMPSSHDNMAKEYEIGKAVENFCAKEWSGHQYYIAHHRKEGRPHSHVIVRTKSIDGQSKITPRFADLKRYRETFADELMKLGVEASATSRLKRLSTRRDLSPKYYERAKRIDKTQPGFLHDQLYDKPWHGIIEQANYYKSIAHIMANGPKEDHELAQQLREYVDEMVGKAEEKVQEQGQMLHR